MDYFNGSFGSLFGEFMKYYVTNNAALFTVVVGMLVLLINSSMMNKRTAWTFRIVALAFLVGSFIDSFEHVMGDVGSVSDWAEAGKTLDLPGWFVPLRRTLSTIGYMIRPIPTLGLIYATLNNQTKKIRFLWVPLAVEWVIYIWNLFPQTAFITYTDNLFDFNHNPFLAFLRYSVFIVGALYLVALTIIAAVLFKDKNKVEIATLVVLSFNVFAAYLVEAIWNINEVGSQVASVGALFYFIFVLLKVIKIDPLTGLYNRQTFYSNAKKNRRISAFVSLDMNGLKFINDNFGHAKGDEALAAVGGLIYKCTPKGKALAYRIGGDEFCVVCYDMNKNQIQSTIHVLDLTINKQTEYKVAIGYAYRDNNEPMDVLMKSADEMMYEVKDAMKKDSTKLLKKQPRRTR